ncbi:LCP family protein [Actinokineospora sp. 24-640]
MSDSEDLIRAVLAAEADQAVDSATVRERLRAGRERRGGGGLVALVGVAVTAAVAAVVVPLVAGRDPAPAPVPSAAAPPRTVVFIGLDSHTYADMVMLARVEEDRLSLLSLPRDTWLDIPGHGMGRLNHAYNHAAKGPDPVAAGAAGVIAAVEGLTGQQVDHYAAVDMAAFQRLAGMLGGVEVCLRAAVSDPYSGADFPAGRQKLSGDDALSFLRQRHGLPNGDLDRVVRHQVFLRGLAGKFVGATTEGITEEVLAAVHTDPGWSPFSLAARAHGPVRMATIPLAESGDAAVMAVDPAAVRAFTAEFFGNAPASPEPGAPGAPTPSSPDGCVN